jgi:hypothetical protein
VNFIREQLGHVPGRWQIDVVFNNVVVKSWVCTERTREAIIRKAERLLARKEQS